MDYAMKKNFINKKLYFMLLLLILIIVVIMSCKKVNILTPTHIPPPTDFRIPEDAIPGHIDVNPMPAKDGEVFGLFGRKFKYKGKLYISAYRMYNYDPKSKTLNRTANNVLLEIDNNANINPLILFKGGFCKEILHKTINHKRSIIPLTQTLLQAFQNNWHMKQMLVQMLFGNIWPSHGP